VKKVAVPYHLGYVSPVFDVAKKLVTVAVADGKRQGREEVLLETADPFLRAQKLKSMSVDVVVCGTISRPYETALSAKGIEVIASVCGPLEEVLSALVNGTLDDERFLMPGLGRTRRNRRRSGRGQNPNRRKEEREEDGDRDR
jgi:predicted Fe-Mo cluster-binding NifX family protein